MRDQLVLQIAQDLPGAQFKHYISEPNRPPRHLAIGDCRFGASKQAISLALR
jgi:hypothetical protein